MEVGSKSKSAQLALSWTSPLDKFTISGIKIVRKGHVVAKSARKHKPKKLKVKVKTGSTFAVIKVSRLVKGKLKFKVKAATIGSGAPQGHADHPGEPESPPLTASTPRSRGGWSTASSRGGRSCRSPGSRSTAGTTGRSGSAPS